MKKIILPFIAILFASTSFSQKAVAPPEGEYSDPSGLSGTYYPTSNLFYNGGKKICNVVKVNFKADENSVTLYVIKGEEDPSVFYMADYRKFARDQFKVSQFSASDFHVFTVEPGVLVLGAYMWAPKDYPGYKKGMMIADTSKLKPVILVKDEAMKSKYTYADAKRIIGEKGTMSEIHNTLRLAANTPTPSIGDLTSDKNLIAKSVELMKAKWAESREPANYQGCYIHSNNWGTVQYGKVQGTGKLTFSDEVTAIMLFKEPETGLCYYYAIGISRESEDFTHKGMETERGLHMTGNSTIQYITEEKLNACLAEINK
jgi:hypothetical protein